MNTKLNYKYTYASYVWKIVIRTMANGLRYHPPSWLEYQVGLLVCKTVKGIVMALASIYNM